MTQDISYSSAPESAGHISGRSDSGNLPPLEAGPYHYRITDYFIEESKHGSPMLQLTTQIEEREVFLYLFEKTKKGKISRKTRAFLASIGTRNLINFSFTESLAESDLINREGIVHLHYDATAKCHIPDYWEKTS